MTKGAVLLTGATGLVGGAMLSRLVAADPDRVVYCLIRAEDGADLARRLAAVLDAAGLSSHEASNVVALRGDVAAAHLGLDHEDAVAGDIDEIVHTAASTRFDLPLDDARAANVAAVRSLVELARRASLRGGFRHLHHVSTAYVVGDAPGVIDEAGPPRGPFRNAYEQSKWEAEEVLRSTTDVGFTIYRPSIIVGDSRTGWTPHFRVLYQPMQWVYFGEVDVIPSRPGVRLDIVPVDYVADSITALMASSPQGTGETFHLTAGPRRSMTIAELIDQAVPLANEYRASHELPPLARPRIATPDEIRDGSETGDTIAELGVSVMRMHMPYMLDEQVFEDSATRNALAGTTISCPHLRDYLSALIDFALRENFGRPAGA